jgi:hypothetical protein
MARKLKLPKGARKDVVRSAPKTTHVSISKDVVRSTPKTTHPNRNQNLGKFARPPAKLPTGAKIGAPVKVKKPRKSNKVKGY